MDASSSRLGDFSRLRPEVRWAAWLALGLAALVIGDQQHYWSTREDFSFGYLVPVFVAYVLHDRWPLLKAILLGDPAAAAPPAESTRAGALNFFAGLVVAGSLLMFLFGGFLRAVTGPDTDSASALVLGFGGFMLSMAFLVSQQDAQGHAITLPKRQRVVALLVFPALAWVVSAPMLLVFETRVKPVLLEWVVRIVSGIFDMLAFDIRREGSVLVLPRGEVGVADACSGIRSLTACLFAGSFLSAVFLDKLWKKIALLALSAVLAFGMNIVRSLFLTSWAYAHNSAAIDADFWGNPEFIPQLDAAGHPVLDAAGLPANLKNPAFHFITVHDFAGYLVLGLTLAGLLLLIPLLNYKIKLPDDEPSEAVVATAVKAPKN
ncbi:MAG TPA: exosortase/archaeosortase family protein [Opitutales bacterium]|nr:exosortase/archaeosortase family protein [Opitutales bacterium]